MCNHTIEDDGTLKYVASYGAPGIGSAYKCIECQQEFAVVGRTVYDPAEGAHIMSPEDCI
jgi:hypothetical protein